MGILLLIQRYLESLESIFGSIHNDKNEFSADERITYIAGQWAKLWTGFWRPGGY